MRKLLLISMGVMLMLGGCAKEKPCGAENGSVCYDEENQRYQIEDGARIRVMVENEAYGQALINLWAVSYTHLDVYKRQDCGRRLDRV